MASWTGRSSPSGSREETLKRRIAYARTHTRGSTPTGWDADREHRGRGARLRAPAGVVTLAGA
ncbi:hypothetical protein GCM10027168_12360 [Streptomyces capparidis]